MWNSNNIFNIFNILCCRKEIKIVVFVNLDSDSINMIIIRLL